MLRKGMRNKNIAFVFFIICRDKADIAANSAIINLELLSLAIRLL